MQKIITRFLEKFCVGNDIENPCFLYSLFCHIYIYYANSESQLLRQASRLENLHKKLVGELVQQDGNVTNIENNPHIPTISSINTLGSSIYGDTLFDDEILPGYVDFIQSLVIS